MSLYAAYIIAGLADDAIEREMEAIGLLQKLQSMTRVKRISLTPQPVQTEQKNNRELV